MEHTFSSGHSVLAPMYLTCIVMSYLNARPDRFPLHGIERYDFHQYLTFDTHVGPALATGVFLLMLSWCKFLMVLDFNVYTYNIRV